jgi:hypothetical protein
MRNGRFDTPKCKGKVQKMGVLCTPPKQPRPLQHARAFKNYKKKCYKKLLKKCHALSTEAAARGRPVVERPTVAQSGATSGRRSLVGAWSTAVNRRPSTALARVPLYSTPCPPPPLPLPTSLPPNFFTCGQLFLIGSSTCPPCPDFS